MTADPKIIGIRLHRPQHAEKQTRGTRAYFDVKVPGFTLTGCTLRMNKQGAIMWSPPLDVLHPQRRHGVEVEPELYRDVLQQAIAAYRGIGGAGLDGCSLGGAT